jgi:hypothetical protein
MSRNLNRFAGRSAATCRVLRGVQAAEGLPSLPFLARPQGGFRVHLRGRSTEVAGSVACGLQAATSDTISYYFDTAAGSDCIDDRLTRVSSVRPDTDIRDGSPRKCNKAAC